MIIPDAKYLLVSIKNNCVYTYTPRRIMATALADGHTDIIIKTATKSSFSSYALFTDRTFFYDKVKKLDDKTTKFTDVDIENVSIEWRQLREQLFLRQNAFVQWETLTANALTSRNKYMWPEFGSYMEVELLKCSPELGQYTPAVEEYARILEMPIDQAFKELKLKIESDTNIKIRIQALAEKWKRRINQGTTAEELNGIRRDMANEFLPNIAA